MFGSWLGSLNARFVAARRSSIRFTYPASSGGGVEQAIVAPTMTADIDRSGVPIGQALTIEWI
jgi:hypothetical protein